MSAAQAIGCGIALSWFLRDAGKGDGAAELLDVDMQPAERNSGLGFSTESAQMALPL